MGRDYRVTFLVLVAGTGAYSVMQSLVVPVLTTVQHAMNASQGPATWAVTGYLLSAAVTTPVLGRLGDIAGKKKVFVAALAAMSAGLVLAGVATSVGVLIVARVIQGAAGGLQPLAFGIIRDEFPKDKVTVAVGIVSSVTAVGFGTGLVLAGPIVEDLGLHWLFWLPLVLSVGAAIAAAVLVPESPVRAPGRISLLPGLTLSAWLVALLLAISQGPDWGWGSPRVAGLLAAAVILILLWLRAESRATAPLIDVRMLRRRAVSAVYLVAFLLGLGMYAALAFLPEFLQTPSRAGYGFGASVTRSGLMLLPLTAVMFVVTLAAGRLTRRFGGRAVAAAGCLLACAGMAVLATAPDRQGVIYLATAVLGCGLGLAAPALAALIVHAVPPHQTGVASGMYANIRTIGGGVGSALMSTIVTSRMEPSGLPAESGYTVGFAVMAGGLALAALFALLVPGAHSSSPADHDDQDLAARSASD